MTGTLSETQYEARLVTDACEVLYVTAGEVVEMCPERGGMAMSSLHVSRCRRSAPKCE